MNRINFAGIKSSTAVIRINTIYSGSCFAINASENFRSEMPTTNMNFHIKGNSSSAHMYLIPQKSINAMILDEWHYHVEKFELRNLEFVEKILTKEYYIKRPTKKIPCTDLSEDAFYKVLIEFTMQFKI